MSAHPKGLPQSYERAILKPYLQTSYVIDFLKKKSRLVLITSAINNPQKINWSDSVILCCLNQPRQYLVQ